jgi:hypothetical protein
MSDKIRFSWFQVPQFFHGGDVFTGGHVFHYICCVMVKQVNLLCQFTIKLLQMKTDAEVERISTDESNGVDRAKTVVM